MANEKNISVNLKVKLTDEEKEKLKKQVEEYEDSVILSRLLGAGGEKVTEKVLEKGAEYVVKKGLQKVGEKAIGLGNPLGTAEEVMRDVGKVSKILITDLKREYKSVRDDTEFRTLEGLIKYEEEYLAIERKKIAAITDDYERSLESRKSNDYKRWAEERIINYAERDRIDNKYQEENLPDFVNKAVKATLGVFPMDTRQKATLQEEVTNKRKLSDEKGRKKIDEVDGILENYKASNSPQIVIYNSEQNGQSGKNEKIKEIREITLPEVTISTRDPRQPQLVDADSSADVLEKNLKKKEESLANFAEANKRIQQDVTDTTEKASKDRTEAVEKENKVTYGSVQELLNNISKHTEMVMMGVTAIFDTINLDMQFKLEEASERYQEISEKHDEMVDKLEENDSRIRDLQEEAKNAQGGRLAVIQEQMAREIESRQELANKEKELAKEKEKAEKDKEKLERQAKKNELKQQIVQGIANIALGVTKAWSFGPILGPIMAAIVGVAGAIQVATMNKQLSKLADGGFLNGRRHNEGGMRIEGTNIEVEGGEYVINRHSTKRNLGLVSYINSQRRQLTPQDIDGYFASSASYGRKPAFKTMFESGGELPSGDSLDTYGDNAVLRAIESINFQPVVSVVDIANVQQSMTQVTDWTNTR